jgi:hypothetical protein
MKHDPAFFCSQSENTVSDESALRLFCARFGERIE